MLLNKSMSNTHENHDMSTTHQAYASQVIRASLSHMHFTKHEINHTTNLSQCKSQQSRSTTLQIPIRSTRTNTQYMKHQIETVANVCIQSIPRENPNVTNARQSKSQLYQMYSVSNTTKQVFIITSRSFTHIY